MVHVGTLFPTSCIYNSQYYQDVTARKLRRGTQQAGICRQGELEHALAVRIPSCPVSSTSP